MSFRSSILRRLAPSSAATTAPGRDLYLDLLKRTLLGLTLEDPSNLYPKAIGDPSELAGYDRQRRVLGADWPTATISMIGVARMDNIRACVESVLRDGVGGDLIELAFGAGAR